MSKATITDTILPAALTRGAAPPDGDAADKTPPIAARRSLLAMPALLGLASVPAAASATDLRDAALIELGRRFEAAWTVERAAWDAAGDHDDDHPSAVRAIDLSHATGDLVDEIKRRPATTLPGLLVKGRALRWCRTGRAPTADVVDLNPRVPVRVLSTDEEVILSVLGDLHAMTGGAA